MHTLRAEHGSKARETTKTHKAAETEWQHKVNREKNASATKVRDTVNNNRAAKQAAAAARREAEADAAAAATRVRELEASLERLRGTRQQTLLDTIEEERAAFAKQQKDYVAEIAVLKQRRKATERKVSDFNLAHRRAALATDKVKELQHALNDYCADDLASDINLAQLEELEAELVAARAELAKEKALRVKYEAVACPPKDYFFKSGAYTAEVDLTAMQLIADCGVASRVVPELFKIFAGFFKVTLPSRTKLVQVASVNGERRYVPQKMVFLPGRTHCGTLGAVAGQLQRVQVR
jgi:hypothetical protein